MQQKNVFHQSFGALQKDHFPPYHALALIASQTLQKIDTELVIAVVFDAFK